MPLKAIFFDAGNTLIFVDPGVVLPLVRDFGPEADQAAFWEAEFEARTRLSLRVQEGATGTEPELWREYFRDLFLGLGVPEEHLDALGERVWRAHEREHLWTFISPDTGPALGKLKEAGYRLAVISNADGRIENLIRKAGIHHVFEFVMDSHEEGVAKPDPEIFLRAARRMGVDPEDSLYVGDLYPVDVLGARNVGMRAILLDPMDRLRYPVERIPEVAALPAFLTNGNVE